MSDSDLEEIKLDVDFSNVRKTSPSCSSNSGRSWMGETFREMKPAKMVPLAKESNNENTEIKQVAEETSTTEMAQNNQRRLLSAPCQKIKQSSGKLLRNIASAKPKYCCNNSKCSTENFVHANRCEKGNVILDPISFHSIANVSSNNSDFSSLVKDLGSIRLKPGPSGDSFKNNVYDMHVNVNQKCSVERSKRMFFPSLKTRDFIDKDSLSCSSSDESVNPFTSAIFQENRCKPKKNKHSFTEESGMNLHMHKSTQMETGNNISPRYKRGEYKTAISDYYNATTDGYKMPFTVVHCGTQTDVSFFTSRGSTHILESVPNKSVSNAWFMLHKATNTSNENCNSFEIADEHLNTTNMNYLHIKIHDNDEIASNGSSRNNLHKCNHNNVMEICDQDMNQPTCGNGCFPRLFSCCF